MSVTTECRICKSTDLENAITLGNQKNTSIFPLLKKQFMRWQRNLVYTGLTRAKKKVIFVGDPAAYSMAIRNDKTLKRQTDLVRKFKKLNHPT